MIGVDPGMADQFVIWVNGVLGAGLNDPELRLKTREELLGFVGAEVAKRMEDPREDLLTELFMELDHPDAKITPEVVVGITNLLIIAGIDTTWSSIESSLWHLATHPADHRTSRCRAGNPADRRRRVSTFLRAGDDGSRGRARRGVQRGRPH